MNKILKTLAQIMTAIFFAFILAAMSAWGATITVTSTNTGGAGSLRSAIASAANGDTIVFNLTGCPCVITGGGYIINGKNLTINGPGADQLMLSGNNTSQVFNINGSSVTLSGLTIANGVTTTAGGGIFYSGSNGNALTILNSTITSNRTTANVSFGGGIFIVGGALSVINSTISNNSSVAGGGIGTSSQDMPQPIVITVSGSKFSGNTASGSGGAVYTNTVVSLTGYNNNFNTNSAFEGGALTNAGAALIRGGSITGNSATIINGGGILNHGPMTLEKVAVQNNTAAGPAGGGIYSDGELKITNGQISGNQAAQGGGGIYSAAALTITGSTISGNTASVGGGGGGGIANKSNLTLTNSTISGNQVTGAGAVGGGIYNEVNSTATITNCTITLNFSRTRAGGITTVPGTGTTGPGSAIKVGNTIIAQNTTGSTTDSPDAFGLYASNGFNLIGNFTGGNKGSFTAGFTNGVKGDLVGGLAGIPVIDARLAPLANNGGLTQTHALLADSPAIDRGNSASGIVTDQRDRVRFFDVPTIAAPPGGNNSDIGAFEFASPTAAMVTVDEEMPDLNFVAQ